jgi:hypothetical protein
VTRLLRSEQVGQVWLVTTPEGIKEVQPLVGGLPVRFFPSDAPDIPSRERLRRGRTWALGSWRGGLGHSYFTCEAGRPASLLALCRKQKLPHLLVVPAEAPLLAAELIDDLLATFRRDGAQKKLYLGTAPPGLGADLYSIEVLEILAETGRSVDGILDFRPDEPNHYVDGLGLFHWYPNTVTGVRARLCADTERSLRRVQAIAGRFGAAWSDVTAQAVLDALGEDPRLTAGDFPQEILLEVTTRRHHHGPADGPRLETRDLPPAHVASILEECAARDDVRFSLGILGDPLLHPRIGEILELFTGNRPFGLHVHTDGLGLSDDMLERLVAADPDVVSVSIDAATPATYEALHGIDGLARATENADRLAEALLPRDRFLVPEFALCGQNAGEVEAFYDRWYAKTGWVTVRDHDHLAGQRPALQERPHVPPERGFCAHLAEELAVLPTGTLALCRQDLRETAPLGTAGKDAIAGVWASRPLACDLCPACTAWAF